MIEKQTKKHQGEIMSALFRITKLSLFVEKFA
jgi:hypothetical protein